MSHVLSVDGRSVFNLITKSWFHLYCITIATISALDIYWLSKYRSGITEQNPLGKYLIALDGGDISLFILFKILGTFAVIGILYILWSYKSRYGIVVAISITIAQCILLFYLVFYDPITYGERHLIKNRNLYQKIIYRIGGMIGPIPEDVEKYHKSSQP